MVWLRPSVGSVAAEGLRVRLPWALVAQQGLVNGGASQGELNLEVAADRDWRPCAPAPTSLTM